MTPAETHAAGEAMMVTRRLWFGRRGTSASLRKFTTVQVLYTEQAAGFYDFKRKTMFIADWGSGPDMQAMTLAHELTHALQDQNFDLDRYVHARHNDDDATGADGSGGG